MHVSFNFFLAGVRLHKQQQYHQKGKIPVSKGATCEMSRFKLMILFNDCLMRPILINGNHGSFLAPFALGTTPLKISGRSLTSSQNSYAPERCKRMIIEVVWSENQNRRLVEQLSDFILDFVLQFISRLKFFRRIV